MMNKYLRVLALCAAGTLTVACGGGGGGGGGGGPVGDNGDPTGAVITTDNAQDIAGDVVSGVMDTRGLGEFGGAGLASNADAGPMLAKVGARANRALTKGIDRMLAAPIGPEVSQCDVAGTLTVTGNLASMETLTAGDNVRLSFAGCDNGDGEVVSGDLALGIDTFSGDFLTGFFALGVTAEFEVFRVTEAGQTTTVNGDASILFDNTGYPTSTFVTSGASLSVTDGSETVVLLAFSVSVTVDESSQPASYSFDASGTVDVPQHGAVTYRVLTPFTGFGDADPDAGVLYIEGDGGGNITVTALSSQQAQLEMDYDGDGVTDEIVTVTWVVLDD